MPYLILFISELLTLHLLSRRVVKSIFHSLYSLTKSRRITMYFLAFLFLPGTFLHELSHWLAATLLFVRTGKFSIWPEIDDQGIKLGSVEIARTDVIRRFLIGVAPFVIGTFLIILSLLLVTPTFDISAINVPTILVALLVFEIGNTMYSSKKDLEGSLIIIILVVSFILGMFLLGIKIDISHIYNNFNFEEYLKKANILLSVPIFINFGGVMILRILEKIFGARA